MLILLCIALVNFIVDPYWVYRAVSIEGFNKHKPTVHNFLYINKAHAVYNIKPTSLILGTSRAGVGLDPEHSGWQSAITYNLALPGATMKEVLMYFKHYQAVTPINKIVLSLDFSSFNSYRQPKEGYSEERLMNSEIFGKSLAKISDLFTTLLSGATLNQSLYVMRKNIFVDYKTKERFMENGQAEWTHNIREIRDFGGHRKAMRSVEDNYMKNVWFPMPKRKFALKSEGTESHLDHYKEILKIAHENNMQVDVMIAPMHARLQEAIDVVGLWDEFELWKRELIRINEELASVYSEKYFSIWDFSGYNKYNNENVPGLDDADTLMKWWWESTHFRPELGSKILEKILITKGKDKSVEIDFGRLIHSKNIDEVLEKIRIEQYDYRKSHNDFYNRLITVVPLV